MERYSYVVLALIFASAQGLPLFLRDRLGRHGLLGAPAVDRVREPPVQWLTQRLDHFNKQDDRTWQQRYWVNDSFWDRTNGPVFLMIAGEAEASWKWVVSGEMMTNAQKFRALAVQLEHRFYGESRPLSDLSLDNMAYLSSQQALADLSMLHDFLVNKYNMTSNNRWISFGGSYSGALSAWFRIKYPHIVVGAVATSAPVQAEYDYYQYMEVVGQSLSTAVNGQECVEAVQNASSTLDSLLIDETNWPSIEKLFNVSQPLRYIEDAKTLSEEIFGLFMEVVQYNNDTREGSNGTVNINFLCQWMTNTSLGIPLQRLAALNAELNPFSMDANFSAGLAELSETSWNSSAAFGDRQWTYQTCKEFAYFQTTGSHDQPFGKLVTMDLFTLACQRVFNIDPFTVQKNVLETNSFYGGKKIPNSVTNIVFPNGSIDPWHALGVTESISETLTSIYIQGTAHCANMYPSTPQDPPALVAARNSITDAISGWLNPGLSPKSL